MGNAARKKKIADAAPIVMKKPPAPAVRPVLTHDYEALNDMVICWRLEEEEDFTAGGLVKPDIAKERGLRAEVVIADEGGKVKVGEVVLITKYGGTDVKLEGHLFALVHIMQCYVRDLGPKK
jgi:chaperonin GroES